MITEEKIAHAQFLINETYSNYVGNKRKLCSWIASTAVDEGILNEDTYFIDVFGGSGSVSFFLSLLGLSGCINELLYSSHAAHCSMFGSYPSDKETLASISQEIPKDVSLKRYIYSSVKETVKNPTHKKRSKQFFSMENDAFAQAGIIVDKKDLDQVSIGVDFESSNIIFSEIMRVFTPWIKTNFSAKEAFELACVLTNSIMDGYNEYNIQTNRVKCFQGDAVSFLKNKQWAQWGKLENTVAYLDPPYGADNANSKYHFIYYLAEIMAYAVKRLHQNYQKAVEQHGREVAHQLMESVPDASHNVDLLPHIKSHSLRYSNSSNFHTNFEELILALVDSKIPVWMFSFSGETNFATARDIAKYLNKFCSTVAVDTIQYNYSFRGNLSQNEVEDNIESLEGMVLGQENNSVGRKTTSENEVLFICKV